MIPQLLATALAGGVPVEPEPQNLVLNILIVVVLFVGALVLLVLEFFIVSFGIMSSLSALLAVLAIIYAFSVNAVFGWSTLVAAPLIAVFVVRWGFARLARSKLVVQGVVAGDAGIRDAATRRGVEVGRRGVMVTPGRPSGRARFDREEMDVACQGGILEAGDAVEVVAIEGPSIIVKRIEEPAAEPAADNS